MINLMPPEAKQAVMFARLNERLLKWTIGCLIIIAIMAATVVAGGFYIENTKHTLTTSIAATQNTIKTQKLDQVQKQATDLSAGLKLVAQILSKEILFSKLLQQIGTLMPANATLGDVQLSNAINGGVDLVANAVDYQSATQVQVNLQDPKNNLFDKVDTVSVSCGSGGTGSADPRYPCEITLRAQFKAGASVTFLANPPAGATK